MPVRSICFGLALMFIGATEASSDPSIGYVRKSMNPENQRVIIFVHGYRSGGDTAWFNVTDSVFWPDLIATDDRFSDYDIFVHDYFSEYGGQQASPGELSANLDLVMRDEGLSSYNEIVFVAHSMGGIIVRDLVNSNSAIAKNVTAVVTYGSPFDGSKLASMARYLRSDRQAIALSAGDNQYLEQVARQWQRLNAAIPSYCAFELEDTYGFRVVGKTSATYACTENQAIQADHGELVTPNKRNHLSYRLLSVAAQSAKKGDAASDQSGKQVSFAVNGEMWGEGVESVGFADFFVVDAPRDGSTCSRRIVRQPRQYCPTFEGLPVVVQSIRLGQPEGNGGSATAEVTDGGRCITAYVTSIDDGRGPFGDCKGRSWLTRQEVHFDAQVQLPGRKTAREKVVTTISTDKDGDFSFAQQYSGSTENFSGLFWRYNLNVSLLQSERIVDSFNLTEPRPAHQSMRSSMSDGLLLLERPGEE